MERRFQIEGHECCVVVTANGYNDSNNPKATDHLFGIPSAVEWVNIEAFLDGELVRGTNVKYQEDFIETIYGYCSLLVGFALQENGPNQSEGMMEILSDLQFK
ncbi:hypothetical protein [Spirosoma arcticum]